MCCSHWSSFIIAEKILTTKPVRSVSIVNNSLYLIKKSVTSPTDSESSDYKLTELLDKNLILENDSIENENVVFGLEIDSNENNKFEIENHDSHGESSGMPEWLKNDLEDAPIIPIEALGRREKLISDLEEKTEANENSNDLKTVQNKVE